MKAEVCGYIYVYEIKGKKRKNTFSFDVTVTMFIYMFNNNLHLPIDDNRGVVISISKEDEKGLSKLFPKQWKTTGKWNSNVEKTFIALKEATSELSIIPNDDTEQRRMSRQTLTLFKLMVGNLDAKTIDDTIATNSVVSSFCWSFGVRYIYLFKIVS